MLFTRSRLRQFAPAELLLLLCSLPAHSQTGMSVTSYEFLVENEDEPIERYAWRTADPALEFSKDIDASYARDPLGDAPECASGERTPAPGSTEPSRSGCLDLPRVFKYVDQRLAFAAKQDSREGAEQTEHYHWKGLLWQSFAFFGVENSFRLMTDPYFRHLTADKPFWHDYIASLKQWNMGRWNDGDDFLVAYVGHPMQGSVTEFIEIQNDPHDRFLEISSDRAYWTSRFKSFLWATAYSTDQKVGPLGESALGSEGGYTYPIGCPAPCPSYQPGLYKVTNNTGWVKLVTTPVVGTLWTMAEDFLDRYVSDRVQGDNMEANFPKILRGSLNPSRTMANGLQGHKPWYRHYQHPETAYVAQSGVHVERDDAESYRALPRLEIFPHLNAISLPINTASCAACRQTITSPGAGFSLRWTHWVDFDSDVDYLSDASPLPSDRAGGDGILGTFGLRTGFETTNYSLKASLRPGFLSYDRAYLNAPSATEPMPQIGRITHFVTSLAVTGDYGIGQHFALRFSAGNTPVRFFDHEYDRPPGVGSLPYLNWITNKVFATNENWTYQTGPVLRF